jgi:hypothetical protein
MVAAEGDEAAEPYPVRRRSRAARKSRSIRPSAVYEGGGAWAGSATEEQSALG